MATRKSFQFGADFDGRARVKRRSGAPDDVLSDRQKTAALNAMPASIASTTAAVRTPPFRAGIAAACVPDCATHLRWGFTSCAVWKRSSGFLLRQVRTQ